MEAVLYFNPHESHYITAYKLRRRK